MSEMILRSVIANLKTMFKNLLNVGLFAGLLLIISCEQAPKKTSIKWRAKSIRFNKLIYAFNIDSLPVKAGDTVLLNYNDANYYISNCAYPISDTAYLSSYTDSDGVEQPFHYEAVNVVLLDNNVE